MEWQGIETAPKDGRSFIGWNGRLVCEFLWNDEPDDDGHVGWCCSGFDYGGILYELHNVARPEPTHWMPLPPPPEPST